MFALTGIFPLFTLLLADSPFISQEISSYISPRVEMGGKTYLLTELVTPTLKTNETSVEMGGKTYLLTEAP